MSEESDGDLPDVASAEKFIKDMLASVTILKATPLLTIGVSALLLFAGPVRLSLWYALGVASTPVMISTIANLLARSRGREIRDPILGTVLDEFSKDLGVPTPRLLVRSSPGQGIQLRGRSDRPAIVVTTGTITRWREVRRRALHPLAHEFAHLRSGDLSNYFRLLAVATLSGTFLIALAIGTPLYNPWTSDLARGQLLVGLMTAVLVLSLRDFLRFREYAADMVAALLVGWPSFETTPADANRASRLLGTHPSPVERRRAMEDPGRYFSRASVTFFNLGVAITAGSWLLRLRLVDVLKGSTALHVSIALASLVAAMAIGHYLTMQTVLGDEGRESAGFRLTKNFRALWVGMSVSLLILIPEYEWLPMSILAVMIAVGSRVLSRISLGMTNLLLAALDDDRYYRRLYVPLIYALLPLGTMLATQEAYLLLTVHH